MDDELTEQAGQSFAKVVWRRAPWILACLVLLAGVTYGYSKSRTKKYTATAALEFNNDPIDEQIAGLSAGGTTIDLLAQQNSNRELVKLSGVAGKTATLVGHGLTEEISESLSISAQGETSIVTVASTSTSPVLAREIANTYATQFVKEQERANREYFKSALTVVNRQLRALKPVQRFGTDGLELEDRAQTLSLLAELNYGGVQLVQSAAVPSSPSSPSVHKDTALGALVGLLLGLGIAFLLERLDRRIREPEDLEAIYHLPMLGIVPKSSALARSRDGKSGMGIVLPPAEAEAFNLIRAHLRFFNIDRDLRTLVIASPAPGDGKTTVARNLAEAAARLGSRVLLVEADLRDPTLARQFYIQPGPGLAGTLIGAISMAAAIQSVAVAASSGDDASGRTMDVLFAGALLPPNPGELLESRAMDVLLERARSDYDFVVLDSAPLTIVSDTFPLLTKVDGVVIVGWVGHSKRDAAEQLKQVLVGSGAPLLGVIASGAKSAGRSSYPAVGGGTLMPPISSPDGDVSSQQLAQAAAPRSS